MFLCMQEHEHSPEDEEEKESTTLRQDFMPHWPPNSFKTSFFRIIKKIFKTNSN